MMKNLLLILFAVAINTKPVYAAITFLPDWNNTDLEFQRDEPLCIEAVDFNGDPLYHMADGCPKPKIFDEYCPHDSKYISKCYCPAHYQYNCVSPERGDERVKQDGYASCDGLYIACCDGSCPSGTSKTDPGGCGGSTTNGCGDTCYYPYQPCCYPASDETGCSCGTYTCDDGCGGSRTCCASCQDPDPDPPSSSSSSNSSNSSNSSTSSNSCVAGGSKSCSGQTSPCGANQTQTGSCTDCSGTKRYSCANKDDPNPCAGKTSKSCEHGCASYDSQCPSICTSCKSAPPCNVSCPAVPDIIDGCRRCSSWGWETVGGCKKCRVCNSRYQDNTLPCR